MDSYEVKESLIGNFDEEFGILSGKYNALYYNFTSHCLHIKKNV